MHLSNFNAKNTKRINKKKYAERKSNIWTSVYVLFNMECAFVFLCALVSYNDHTPITMKQLTVWRLGWIGLFEIEILVTLDNYV